ncbi:MAG: hypothetical protein AB7G93_19660 [Bdellovibrionales bacterium]
MNPPARMRSFGFGAQGGQMITEAVLILVLLFGFTFIVATYFRNEEVVRRLIQGPWQNLAGLLQNGVWAPPQAGAVHHPSGHYRHIVIQGELAR